MTLSKAEKDFWTETITAELNLQIDQLTVEHDPRVQALQTARGRLIEAYGMVELLARYDELTKATKAAQDEYTRLDSLKDAEEAKIKKIMETHPFKRPIQETYYPRSYGWEENLRLRAEAEMPAILKAEHGELGAKVANLLLAIDNLEKTIMLATSGKQLRTFLDQFAKKLNLNLGETFNDLPE